MRFAVVANDRVVEIVLATANTNEQWVESDTAQVGDVYDGEAFTPGQPDPSVLIEANVTRAKAALVESDWSDLPSVRNVAIEPHLLNGADFDTYRAGLRAIVVGKPAVVETWPVRPDAVWSELTA